MQIEFPFEELCIHRTPSGREAGSFNGVATIDFGADRLWRVEAIEIECVLVDWDEAGQTFGTETEHCAPPHGIKQMLEMALLTSPRWSERVQEAVDEALRQRSVEGEDSAFKRAYAREVQV